MVNHRAGNGRGVRNVGHKEPELAMDLSSPRTMAADSTSVSPTTVDGLDVSRYEYDGPQTQEMMLDDNDFEASTQQQLTPPFSPKTAAEEAEEEAWLSSAMDSVEAAKSAAAVEIVESPSCSSSSSSNRKRPKLAPLKLMMPVDAKAPPPSRDACGTGGACAIGGACGGVAKGNAATQTTSSAAAAAAAGAQGASGGSVRGSGGAVAGAGGSATWSSNLKVVDAGQTVALKGATLPLRRAKVGIGHHAFAAVQLVELTNKDGSVSRFEQFRLLKMYEKDDMWKETYVSLPTACLPELLRALKYLLGGLLDAGGAPAADNGGMEAHGCM